MDEAARESQVTQHLISLAKAAEALHHSISDVEERITPILRPKMPQDTISEPKQPDLVPLAHEILAHTEKVRAATAKLENMLSRLEL